VNPVEFMDSYVILITADPGAALQKKAVYEGIQAYLPNPFSIDLMRDLMKPLNSGKISRQDYSISITAR
jgi:hypothetical protein